MELVRIKICVDWMEIVRWWVGPWQYCSLTCGEKGIRRRTVICVRSLSDDEQVALHDADCPANDRPTEEDLCPDMPPCPGQVTWKTGPWSKVHVHYILIEYLLGWKLSQVAFCNLI